MRKGERVHRREREYSYRLCIGEQVRERVVSMKIGAKIDSDHQPVEVTLRGGMERRGKGRKEKRLWRGVWDKEGCEEFRERLGKV